MKKTFIIIAILVVAAAGFFIAANLIARRGGTPPSPASPGLNQTVPPIQTASSTPPLASSTGSTITIGTPNGSVTVKNFYASSTTIYPEGDQQVRKTPLYEIVYNKADSSFSIGILQSPVAPAIAAAENDLLQTLGISQQQACQLKVTVGIPWWVDEANAGGRGLSFCVGK